MPLIWWHVSIPRRVDGQLRLAAANKAMPLLEMSQSPEGSTANCDRKERRWP